MRVYPGGDHAGYELKQAIFEHLKGNGHEPIDCGARSTTTPRMTTRPSASPRRSAPSPTRQPGHRARRFGQRRADRSQQGARGSLRAGVERRNRQAGPRTQQRAADRHRWPHAYRSPGAGNRRRLRQHPLVEPNGINAASTSWTRTSAPRGARRPGRARLTCARGPYPRIGSPGCISGGSPDQPRRCRVPRAIH